MEEGEELRLDGQPLEVCPEKVVSRVTYHDKLNVILAGTTDGWLYVVDPTLGEAVYSTRIGWLSNLNIVFKGFKSYKRGVWFLFTDLECEQVPKMTAKTPGISMSVQKR